MRVMDRMFWAVRDRFMLLLGVLMVVVIATTFMVGPDAAMAVECGYFAVLGLLLACQESTRMDGRIFGGVTVVLMLLGMWVYSR